MQFFSQLLCLITSRLPSRLMPAPSPPIGDLESVPSSRPQPSPCNTTSESQAPPSPQSTSGVRDPLPPTINESQRNNILDAKPDSKKELGKTLLGFCFGVALQNSNPSKQAAESETNNSISLLSLGTAAIFGSLFTSHFIGENMPNASRMLDKVAFFLAATTFFFAIAAPCPLGIKCAIWALYIFSLIAIAACNFPHVFWRRVDTRATSTVVDGAAVEEVKEKGASAAGRAGGGNGADGFVAVEVQVAEGCI